MSYGARIFNSSGKITLDLTKRTARIKEIFTATLDSSGTISTPFSIDLDNDELIVLVSSALRPSQSITVLDENTISISEPEQVNGLGDSSCLIVVVGT